MSNKQSLQDVLKKEMSRREFLKFNALILIAVFGISGLIREILSHAATFATAEEAEDGALSSNAKKVTDGSASGGQAVRFEPATTGNPRDSFVIGNYKPDASNTGYLPGTSFTSTISNNITYSSANNGQTIQNTIFTGKVTVTGQNITFRNCWFRSSSGEMLNCNNDTVDNLLIEDCTFKPMSPNLNLNAIFGRNFTAKRCNISGTVDAFSIVGKNTGVIDLGVNILGCYAHDLSYFSPCPHHSDNQTHNDVIQVHYGGSNIVIRGNTLRALIDPNIGDASEPSVDQDGQHISGNTYYPSLSHMSVLMLSPIAVNITNLTFDKNYADGGACLINCGSHTAMTGFVVSNNKWGRNMRLGETFTILAKAAQPITITGNVYEDNGASYNGRRNG
jgi:hypothetical protein